MTLDFLRHGPTRSFRRVEADLNRTCPDVDLTRYKRMTPRGLEEALSGLRQEEQQMIQETQYGSWLSDPAFTKNKLMQDALELLQEHKEEQREQEVLVPGFTYYAGVNRFGDSLKGFRCHVMEGYDLDWMPFREHIAVAKAKQVLRHGSHEQFRTIYVEMADGCVDALEKPRVEHLTMSSREALTEIEKYCDENWSGPWPWEIPAPYTLREKIEDNRAMHAQQIREMQDEMVVLLRKLDEDDMNKFELVTMVSDMMGQVDNMIGSLGKMSSGSIEASAAARAAGSEEIAQGLESLQQNLNQVAQMLSQMKFSIQQALDSVDTSGAQMGGAQMGAPMGGDQLGGDSLGTPGDAMGDSPMGMNDGLDDQIADMPMDGGEARPVKPM